MFSRHKKCMDHFHEKCINKWVLKSFTENCPYCTNRFDGEESQKAPVDDVNSQTLVQSIDV